MGIRREWTASGDRLTLTWDETEGPPVETVGPAGFGAKLLKSTSFDGKTEIAYLKTGVHCTVYREREGYAFDPGHAPRGHSHR